MKLKDSVATETFISEGGYYTLRQENYCNETQIVSLTPSQMLLVISDMQKWLSDESWQSDVIED